MTNKTQPSVKERKAKTKKQKSKETTSLLVRNEQTKLSSPEFIKVEKNLASLGFFTPSSKNTKNAKKKTITFTKVVDGKKIEASATIVPSASYGLPTTADQDKYLALQKIITDIHQQNGSVQNPIIVGSAELLRQLNQTDSGTNFKNLEEWLDRMYFTSIISEGAVYFAGKKIWTKDRFRVFDRVVTCGHELEPGKIAEKNYIWLSAWQLENINNNHLLPVDLETYKKLKTSIAKVLAPLLQIWLYATREEGIFEKRYSEICQLLNLREYQFVSKIKEKLSPSLDELKEHGYLTNWELVRTTDKQVYKIIFYHGPKFYQDRIKRIDQKGQASNLPRPKIETPLNSDTKAQSQPEEERSTDPSDPKDQLIAKLADRGTDRRWATKYIHNISADALAKITDLIEYFDWIVRNDKNKVKAPGGYLRTMIEEEWTLPPNLQTSRQCEEQAKAREKVISSIPINIIEADAAYQSWWNGQVDDVLNAKTEADREELESQIKEQVKKRFSKEWQRWTKEQRTACLQQSLKKHIANELRLPNFDEWLQRKTVKSDNSVVIL